MSGPSRMKILYHPNIMLDMVFFKSLFLLFISINLVRLNDSSNLQLFYYNFIIKLKNEHILIFLLISKFMYAFYSIFSYASLRIIIIWIIGKSCREICKYVMSFYSMSFYVCFVFFNSAIHHLYERESDIMTNSTRAHIWRMM